MIDHLEQRRKEMCTCKKPLKELKMLIAYGTGFTFEMFISTYFFIVIRMLEYDGKSCFAAFLSRYKYFENIK